MPRVSGWALVLGVGAALAAGQGVAHADSSDTGSSKSSSKSQPSKPHSLNQLKKDVSRSLADRSSRASSAGAARSSTVSPGAAPRKPLPSAAAAITNKLDAVTVGAKRPLSTAPSDPAARPLADVLAPVRTALERTVTGSVAPNVSPSIAPGAPSPTDTVQTAYGAIGKWMLQPGGGVSEWGGQPYFGKTLVEPINVIIIDPTSTTPEQSTTKLKKDMARAGFPAQLGHSTGFTGLINGTVYGQQPNSGERAFSDNLYILPNDHARAFGPAPMVAGTGYVWSVAASTETPGIYMGQLTHSYVSFDLARNILVLRLLLSGGATFVGVVPMENAYNTKAETTGDHDGYAVVLRLN